MTRVVPSALLAGGLLAGLLLPPAGPARAAAVDPGAIPADRLPPAGWTDTQWQDPGGWTTIDVTQRGLRINDPDIDAATAGAAIVDATSGRRVLYFPAGSYHLRSALTLTTGDLILRGAGLSLTRFVIEAPAAPNTGITFAGSMTATTTAATGSPAAYPVAQRPYLKKVAMLHNVGVEQLQIERLTPPTVEPVNNLALNAVSNAAVGSVNADTGAPLRLLPLRLGTPAGFPAATV